VVTIAYKRAPRDAAALISSWVIGTDWVARA